MTQKLFEACNIQGDYKIPQLQGKGAEIPKTGDGEHIGVGESWWYEGLSYPEALSGIRTRCCRKIRLIIANLPSQPSRTRSHADFLNMVSDHVLTYVPFDGATTSFAVPREFSDVFASSH
jgi:cytochrome b pre-mRNA-processing protein 3